MAKLEDVFVVEAERRESEKWSKIHLFKMGDFWRAYEWSAWLIAVITYNEKVRMTTRDFDFILWLTEQIVMLDPMEHCTIVGDDSDWDDIDHAKCMRYVEKGLALPIGNLTSQLYNNVYMNVFDQFVKRKIKCRHYGRYVDDSTMIDTDKEWLLKQVPKVREFLDDELGLQLHMGKLHIQEIHKGVEFLGTFVKPYRDYISNKTLERIKEKMQQLDLRNTEKTNRTINSYLGILSHTASYNLQREMFGIHDISQIIEFDADFMTSKPQAA